MKKDRKIRRELLDELLAGYKTPEDLTGPGGILKQLTGALVERALEAELTDHLGYDEHAVEGRGSGNSRNGSGTKTLQTEQGPVHIDVPRDRNGRPNPNHDLYRRDQTNTDGSFTLNRVVPGNYTLVAIENGWTLDWGRPEVIAPYLAGGLKLQIIGQKTLDLPAPLEVLPR